MSETLFWMSAIAIPVASGIFLRSEQAQRAPAGSLAVSGCVELNQAIVSPV